MRKLSSIKKRYWSNLMSPYSCIEVFIFKQHIRWNPRHPNENIHNRTSCFILIFFFNGTTNTLVNLKWDKKKTTFYQNFVEYPSINLTSSSDLVRSELTRFSTFTQNWLHLILKIASCTHLKDKEVSKNASTEVQILPWTGICHTRAHRPSTDSYAHTTIIRSKSTCAYV